MTFRIKFEFYGRKMQTDIEADTEEQAKEQVRNRLKFFGVKIVDLPKDWDFLTEFNKIMGKI
jgi:extradiol dioxygenase family protein